MTRKPGQKEIERHHECDPRDPDCDNTGKEDVHAAEIRQKGRSRFQGRVASARRQERVIAEEATGLQNVVGRAPMQELVVQRELRRAMENLDGVQGQRQRDEQGDRLRRARPSHQDADGRWDEDQECPGPEQRVRMESFRCGLIVGNGHDDQANAGHQRDRRCPAEECMTRPCWHRSRGAGNDDDPRRGCCRCPAEQVRPPRGPSGMDEQAVGRTCGIDHGVALRAIGGLASSTRTAW